MIKKNPTLVRDLIFTLLQFIILKNYVTGFLALYFVLKANDYFVKYNFYKYEEYTRYSLVLRILGWLFFGCLLLFKLIAYLWQFVDFSLGKYSIHATYV